MASSRFEQDAEEDMRFDSLRALTTGGVLNQAKGPVAAIIAEDEVEVESTVRHHADKGFRTILLFAPAELELDDAVAAEVIRTDFPTLSPDTAPTIVNAIVPVLPRATWLYYCYNAEYLFYPFSETRTVGEMLMFHTEERRSSMLTYVIDLYAGDLGSAGNAVALGDAWFDETGYYARARDGTDGPKERQLDFHGGLRWRFEEHIDEARRRIDRIGIVRTAPGIRLLSDHTWSEEELNTYSCPWHHNLTAAIMSFRTAKALRTNPSSRRTIDTFRWRNSTAFEWRSQQLLDLGFIETGQWF